jgi:hypothetical protein
MPVDFNREQDDSKTEDAYVTKQNLFYGQPVPVSAKRHHDWSLEPRTDYAFAGHSNAVPLAAAEFPAAAQEYAIVFTGTGEHLQPAVILGLKSDENRYLNASGKWQANYIPAFVRQYPFVFSKSEDGDKFVLCIDEAYTGWNRDGRGKALFDDKSKGSDFLDRMFRFVTDSQRRFDATAAFCKKLQALDLLEPMTARFQLPSGQKAQLTGFLAIDRDKLKALPGDRLAELSQSGELELMYAHLLSMRNFSAMLARSNKGPVDRGSPSVTNGSDTDQPLH